MANYYVDLNSATNPVSVGSAVDPFGVTEYIAAAAGAGLFSPGRKNKRCFSHFMFAPVKAKSLTPKRYIKSSARN